MNTLGLGLLYEHGGHSHSSLTSNHDTLVHLADRDDNENNSFVYKETTKTTKSSPPPVKKSSHGHSHDPSQMNMRGAFLHVLSDALGSIIVIISAMVTIAN